MEEIDHFYSQLGFGNLSDEIRWKEWEVKEKGILYYVIDAITKNCARGCSILDIGGGSGVNLTFYGKAIGSSKLYCIDIREPSNKIDGITYIRSPVENLQEISEGPFDCMVMTEVLEHLYDPDRVIDNLLKKLKHDGTLIITTPNLTGFLNVFSLALGFQPVDTEVSTVHPYGRPLVLEGNCVGHIRVFSLKALREMLAFHDLEITSIRSIGRTKPNGGPLKLRFVSLVDRIFSKLSSRGGTRIIAICRKK